MNGYAGSFGDCTTHPAVNDYPNFGVQVANSQGSCASAPNLIQNTDQKGILTGQGISIQNSTANFTVLVVSARLPHPAGDARRSPSNEGTAAAAAPRPPSSAGWPGLPCCWNPAAVSLPRD